MKRFQTVYLHLYRAMGFIFLMGLVTAIVWYAFSILFFSLSSSWSIPLTLSPAQEGVIGHLSRVSTFEQELKRHDVELLTAKEELSNKQALLEQAQVLQLRLEQSVSTQANRYAQASARLRSLAQEKNQNVKQMDALASKTNQNQAALIDKELKAGLITRQEANAQHLTLSNMNSGLVDAKASALLMNQQADELGFAASTLKGSANNLDAINNVAKQVELNVQIEQLKSDVFRLTATIDNLEKTVQESNRVIAVIKESPYLLATRAPTTVAFVPYDNMSKAKEGAKIYSCYLEMIFCYKSGEVVRVYEAEEYGRHPIFKSDLKGRFVGIKFDNASDAEKDLLFIDGKPLLF